MSTLSAADRKKRPIYSGVLAYFPDAIAEVAYVSWLGNEQHNPGEPLHWDRSKSSDDSDAAARHMTDSTTTDLDVDGGYHLAKAAWRNLATLQKKIEARRAAAKAQDETVQANASRFDSHS